MMGKFNYSVVIQGNVDFFSTLLI
ncbi:hypothetical protein FEZ51_10245 [Pediococcus stilesii]|uniref:Uncharacterized protein n=1 Tax=Pediococcus stilesii TaxID=331679 RepID=A0A5R9BS98_9LACO|nr:hypothetical protein FEZ51_10245 [Pediococcus stilesii]